MIVNTHTKNIHCTWTKKGKGDENDNIKHTGKIEVLTYASANGILDIVSKTFQIFI